MKKEIDIVPYDKCVLTYIAELGERTANASISIDEGCLEQMYERCDKVTGIKGFMVTWHYNGSYEYPPADVTIQCHKPWNKICMIEADDIAFKVHSEDPVEIFYLKLEEDPYVK